MADDKLTTQDFQELDRLDEQQIIADLEGQVLTEYVYQFRNNGKLVTGLSWAGVKAIANRLGGIQVDLVQVLASDDSYAVVCKATRGQDSRLGAAEQPRAYKGQPDPFSLAKATSKAQRNSIRALLPEALITKTVQHNLAKRRQ